MRSYCRFIKEYALPAYSPPVRRAVACIKSDLTADLSLKTLSGQINVNSSYLSALFKKEVGITLTEYVNRSRIDCARRLLSVTDLPTKSIALQCGLPDVSYFSRLFKRITGVTPKVYREKAKSDREG